MNSLVEMYTGNILQRMFANQIEDDSSVTNSSSAHIAHNEMNLSVIGPLLWSQDYFNDDISSSSTDDDGENDLDPNGLAGTEGIEMNSQQDSISPDIIDNNQKRKRRFAPVRMTAAQVCQELSKPNVSPHLLIAPHIYGESFGAGQGASQPFEVRVHPQV